MWLKGLRHPNESAAVQEAKARLERVVADDPTVDGLLAQRQRITRENGLARDIEQALKARRRSA